MIITRENREIKTLIDCLNSSGIEFDNYYKKATEITLQNFGITRSLFNPVYVSDICYANCPYCGYRVSNKSITRRTLLPVETMAEINFLILRGVQNVMLLAGDYKHSKYVEMIKENINAARQIDSLNWLGVEVATLETDEYQILKKAGANSVTVFQETYDRKTYADLHQIAKYKGDFDFRYFAQERAINAGFEEVGFGVLYGVGFWKNDTIAMAEHALKLKNKYPYVAFRFCFPRLRLSEGQDKNCQKESVTEKQLLKAITGIRLLFPTSSIILTGRETIDFLCRSASIVNVLGYGGSTEVGGYNKIGNGLHQFEMESEQRFEDLIYHLRSIGYETFHK
jgi:2-iminoacetate synthase